MASETYYLYLHTLTPLHVGASEDKHFEKGADYLVKEGEIFLFDQKKLMTRVGVDTFSDALAAGGKNAIENLLKNQDVSLASVAKDRYSIPGDADQIKANIRNGLTSAPIIPGSSIKGAIRSILFKYLFEQSGETVAQAKSHSVQSRPVPPEKHFLGDFDNSIMRFIHCSDVEFESVVIFNTKVFNLFQSDGEWRGGWKHALQNQTNGTFEEYGFTTAYECIPAGSIGRFTLRFDRRMLEQNRNRLPAPAWKLFNSGSDFLSTLFKMIERHTQAFIAKETGFFGKPEYRVEETPEILDTYHKLQSENSTNSPVFRMASGSGFHSITGDWQFEDYVHTGKWNNGKLKYKSRRLAFTSAKNSNRQFFPLGFVQLVTAEYFQEHLQSRIAARETEAEAARLRAEELEKQRQEDEQRRAEEARKPQMRTLQEVKREKVFDGEVVGQMGTQVLVRPFVEGFEDNELMVRYAAGFPKGTIVTVKARVQGKQLVLQPPPKEKK